MTGEIFDDPAPPANRDSLLRQADEICPTLTRLPRPPRRTGRHPPHEGGFIPFADEVARVAVDVQADEAGFCIDAGVFAVVMGERIRFLDACARGVMCLIGRGVIDDPAMRAVLGRIGYAGCVTVEQERGWQPRRRQGEPRRPARPQLRSRGGRLRHRPRAGPRLRRQARPRLRALLR